MRPATPRARGGGRAGGRGDGGGAGAWSSGGGVGLTLRLSGVRRPFEAARACPRPRDRKIRTPGGDHQASAASSANASTDVCPVRHSGKFPNASVAPLRAGRQCKPLRLQEIGSSRQFAATQHFGRFRSEADIDRAALTESGFMSTRLS